MLKTLFIVAPANYDSFTQYFDASAVKSVTDFVMKYNTDVIMVIKSTIPAGHTKSAGKNGSRKILFRFKFLRDIWQWLPSRISWLKMGYDDQKIYENGFAKVFLCRSFCVVISFL